MATYFVIQGRIWRPSSLLMHDDPQRGIERPRPRGRLDAPPRRFKTSLPARRNALRREIEVLELVLARQGRRQQRNDLHDRAAAAGQQFTHAWVGFGAVGQ